MPKFGFSLGGDTEAPYIYPNTWAREQTTGPDRLVIAASGNQIDLLKKLAASTEEPFGLLYVLLVSRVDSAIGRYQNPDPISRQELYAFLYKYADFLEGDARHNLWIVSISDQSQLIYDQHNVIYAYGPLQDFEATVGEIGLTEASEIRFPVPHTHFYNVELDDQERRILKEFDWLHSPLREGDPL